MSIGGIILGLFNVAIVVILLLLVGVVIKWLFNWLVGALPANLEKLYLALVAVIAIYMVVALLLGIPTIRVLRL